MYYGSEEFNNIVNNPNGKGLKLRLTFTKDKTIELVKSLKFYGGSNGGNDIAIGTTLSAYVDVSLFEDSNLTNQEFLLEQGAMLENGEMEYAPIGYFTIQRPDNEDDVSVFTAYDRMKKFDKAYSSNLTYPTTSDKVLVELCTFCGVGLATTIKNPITIIEKLQGYTCREILGYIAGIHGCFACIDRFGKLNIRWYDEEPIEKKLQLVYSMDKAQTSYVVDKIEIYKNAETSYTSGSGTRIIHYSNPYATQEITDDIYSKLGGFTYHPSSIVILDDIRFDPWDVIKIVSIDSDEYLIPCMSIEHNFDRGNTSIQAVGATDTENEYRSENPIIQYLNRMSAELLIVNKIIANTVTVEYLEANYISAKNLDVVKAEIQEAIINDLSANFADIRFANIDVANIDKSNIGLLFAEVGLLTSATIEEGHVTGFLDSVEINANKITAGTLAVDRLIFRGSEKSIVYELNNITGALQSVQGDTLNGEILTDRSITVDKIVAKSITSNEIASKTITASEIMANSITGQEILAKSITSKHIQVESLSALTSNVGTLTAGVIKSSNYIAGKRGMKLDLDAGDLEAYSVDLYGSFTTGSESGIQLNSSGMYVFEDGISVGDIYASSKMLNIWGQREGVSLQVVNGGSVLSKLSIYTELITNSGGFSYDILSRGGFYHIGSMYLTGDILTSFGRSLNTLYIYNASIMLNQELTTSSKVYTTYLSRSISDFNELTFTMGVSATDVRKSITIPTSVFANTSRIFYLDCWSNGGNNFNQIAFSYTSDNQITAYVVYGSINILNVYGKSLK